jgi:hypothetical protein
MRTGDGRIGQCGGGRECQHSLGKDWADASFGPSFYQSTLLACYVPGIVLRAEDMVMNPQT